MQRNVLKGFKGFVKEGATRQREGWWTFVREVVLVGHREQECLRPAPRRLLTESAGGRRALQLQA